MAGYARTLALRAARKPKPGASLPGSVQRQTSDSFGGLGHGASPNRTYGGDTHAGSQGARGLVYHADGIPGNSTRAGQTYKPPGFASLTGSSRQNVSRQFGNALNAAMRRKPVKGRPMR